MGPDPDEAATWSRASSGDDRAFAALFDRYYERVFRHVLALTRQPSDADEVTAATFLALWRLRARVRVVGGSVLPWLLVTAGNLARNHGRKAQRYLRALDRVPREPESVDASEIVAEQDLADRRARALAAALACLPVRDAQLVALTTLDGIPIADAAAAIGLTPGAARVRLHRARRRLRELIDLPDHEDVLLGGAS